MSKPNPTQVIRQYSSDAVVVEHKITEADKENVRRLKKEAEINIAYNVDGQLTISAWSYIGTVEFSNFILRVDPIFVNITNIGRLYDFAYKVNPVRPPGTVRFTGEYNHPLEELVRSFVNECKKILTVGLYKSYKTIDESIPTLKGKLLLKQQMINQSRFNLKFHCEYDEFTPNNLENVIILDCLNTCQRITKNETAQTDIRYLINRMGVEVESRNVDVQEFKKLKYTRMNQNYKDAHTVAKSIIMQRGLMNWNLMRTSFIQPLFMQTWELFEQLVTKLFDKYYPLSIDKQEPITTWKIADRQGKNATFRKMIPDIMVYKKSGVRNKNVAFIADAKMKDDPAIGDSYQMSFYLRKYGIKKGYFLMPQEYKMGHIIEMGNTWKTKMRDTDKQDIEIQEMLFDVDGILDAIWNGREDEIKQRLLELIPPKEFD